MKKRVLAAVAAFFVVAAGLAMVITTGSRSERHDAAAAARDRDAGRDGDQGRKNPRKEAAFEGRSGEADRKGPQNPVVEQVGNRAYPRSYVDDALALKARSAFDAKPSRAASASASAARVRAHSSRRAARRARRLAHAAATAAWAPLGPVTPNVPGEPSQFYDYDTQSGPPTQESGRVTGLAIDPNCGQPTKGCRLWVAAAGGGVWRTNDAMASKPAWIAPPAGLPTNAFGSIYVDPNDPTGSTIYAGSGEPNGSGDSEAGLGLFKSTNGGQSWTLLQGSRGPGLNRSIGAIAVEPGHPNTIYIGTDLARHGSSAANGGRRTPPNAADLGVYKSTDGGTTFTLEQDLTSKTPQNPSDPAQGVDWFQGGISKLEFDPHNSSVVYASVVGYGLWRSSDAGSTWTQVFHTFNQTNFADPKHPGDTYGDRVEFDAVDAGAGKTRIYLGDSSDDLAQAYAWRTNDAAAITGDPNGGYDNSGWTELSSTANGTNGFLVYNYCQNGQCGYDDFVASPPGHPGQVWFGGSMQYDELPAYAGMPPRSNGRAVVRSTNGGASSTDVTWQDMTAVVDDHGAFLEGIHPDLHAITFNPTDSGVAFIGSDGGVVRVDVRSPQNKSAVCGERRWSGYTQAQGKQPLAPADLADCQRLLSAIPSHVTPLNDGLNDMQFQSLSVNPNGNGELLGGTQDNGTWAFSPTAADPLKWFETVGGDGGQSGFDSANPATRYHNYYDATPEVNFNGTDPKEWLDIYDPLQSSKEQRSFYTPFITDPKTGGRAFTGMAHVWRTDDHGGDAAYLEAHCNVLHLDPTATAPCGDWRPLGDDLTGTNFGQSRVGQFVVATERAPSDTGTLWAATRTGRLFITKNADASNVRSVKFVRLDTASTPGRFISGIAVDPGNPNHAWVSYSGYNAYTPDTAGHVFEVTYNPSSGTATFTNRSYDLGDMPATGIAQYQGALYLATDFGVVRLAAGGSHWSDAASGMPTVAVYGLTLDRGTHTLYAATHGRGAYKLGL